MADEPVSALDVATRIEVLELLRRLQATRGLTVVMVSHDISAVAALCPETLVLKDGHVVEHGPTLELVREPREPYTRRLIDAIPRLPSEVT